MSIVTLIGKWSVDRTHVSHIMVLFGALTFGEPRYSRLSAKVLAVELACRQLTQKNYVMNMC